MDRSTTAFLLVAALVIIFTVPTVRSSLKRDAVHGGIPALIFHFIAVAAYIGIVPSALFGSLIAGPLEFGIPLALILLVTSLLALLVYGIFEHPARAHLTPVEERGWTAEDARSSGL